MRDKLIELIQNAVGGCACHWAEIIADHLLAEGVIVPPCKVGDDVYWIDEDNEINFEIENIKAVCYYGNGNFKVVCGSEREPEDIGTRWCMLTRAEANKAQAERKGK